MNIGLLRWLQGLLTVLILFWVGSAAATTIDDLVDLALGVNPQVRAARARWESAVHSIDQNYAPADPIVTYGSIDSPTNGFSRSSEHLLQASEALQFPGKALLQAQTSKRAAEIARLDYDAAVRDVRTRTETQAYQLAVDSALSANVTRAIYDLERFGDAARGNQASSVHRDAVASDIADAQQRKRRFEVARNDDLTRLNQLLLRGPDQPLSFDTSLELMPLPGRVDVLIDRAWQRRQEILQFALHEQNAETAVALARLEYAPDYEIGYAFNHYLLPSDAPAPNLTQTHSFTISFNLPLFFWMKQSEDVKRAKFDLEAAREDLSSVKNETAADVTILYRHAKQDYEDAVVYRDTIVPRSLRAFDSALLTYRNRADEFATLSYLRNQLNLARTSYLQAIASFLADRIALEQELGGSLPK